MCSILSHIEITKLSHDKTIRFWCLIAVAALTVVLALPQPAVMALPNTSRTNQTPRKNKKKVRQQREAKPAKPTEIPVAQEQIDSLNQRVKELSQQLAAQTATLAEDAETRREIVELKARIKAAEERAIASETVVSAFRSELAKAEQSTKAAETEIENVSTTLTGAVNNPLTLDQDFGATVARHPFFINEAWIDVHPNKWLNLQGGRVQEVFADNSRFLFDDDLRFNGFNEKLVHTFDEPVVGIKSIEFRAGQYFFTNPNVAIVTPTNLGPTGAKIGSTGRAAQMFHQGLLVNQEVSRKVSHQFGADIQLYRNPNQILFSSTAAGLPVLIQNGLGLALSGPLPQGSNATTTPGGAIYSAPNFQVARFTYRLDYKGFSKGDREYPISINLQLSRNLGTGQRERDALLASLKVGKVKNRWDQSFLYVYSRKGANALISQLSDDDLGTGAGVNIRTHHFRYDLGLAKGVQLQTLFYIQNALRNSGDYPNFFVPLNAYTPRQYRIQQQIVFIF